MSSEILKYGEALGTEGVHASVVEKDGRLALKLFYSGIQIPDSEQILVLPRFSESSNTPGHQLEITWNESQTSGDMYTSMLEGLSTYLSLKYPGFWVIVPIKIYQQKPHGDSFDWIYRFVPVAGRLGEIEEGTAQNQSEKGGSWTGGYSDVVFVSPEPEHRLRENTIPGFPPDTISKLFIPMLDLDISTTGNSPQDLKEVALKLAEFGLSGWFIRSGDETGGSYHFLADLIMPHDPNFWQVKGKLMSLLTPEGIESKRLHSFAKRLEIAETLQEAKEIAGEILREIPSDSKTESSVDFRWVAHRIEDGVSILRTLPSKGYSEPPRVVGEIKIAN